MIRYEWKKLLFGRKGLLLILLLLIAEFAGTLLFTQPYDAVLENHRAVYESYLAQVEGSLTAENRAYLESEMERLNAVHQELEQLKMDYYSGEITEEAYREAFDRMAPEDARYIGFSTLYSQYIFVRESENRAFLYTGGWELLLTDHEPDYLFLLALIVLLTPVFCEEYACRMHEILLTQKRSARHLVLAKVTVALSLTFVLTVVLQIFDLGYCAARFGLPNGTFTLQSLYSFGDTAKHLTLRQAFGLQFALKVLGYLYASVLVLFLSAVLKKFARTLMASIAVLPLPFLTVGSAGGVVPIPGPWALTMGSVYLNGGAGELSWAELGQLLLMVAAIICTMLYLIRRCNTNWQLKGGTPGKMALWLCVLPLLLAGCAQGEEAVIYNRSAAGQYERDAFVIATTHEGATITEKTTGNTHAFPLTPLEGEIITCGDTLYGQGDAVYYLRATTHHPNAGWDTVDTDCDLVKLDLGTMKESVVYQWNEDTDWFFGLLDRGSTAPASYSVELLFVHGNGMYYVDVSQSTLNRMDLNTGGYDVVLREMYSQDVAYDGQNIYYLDSYNRLVIHNIETGEKLPIDEVVAGQFWLTEDGICFQNRRDGSALYFWSFADQSVEKLNDPA